MPLLFLLFIIMPIVEMVLLIQVGGAIGTLNTIGLVLLTAVIGAWLLRQQGVDTLLRANRRLESGEMPAQELFEGIALAAGGALLLTPGFVTDAIGFALLLPFTRKWLISKVIVRAVSGGGALFYQRTQYRGPTDNFGATDASSQAPQDPTVIEGEYTRHE